ncbi:hypothetical protein [Streptomyces flaveolus]|uniref:hypothetical protein n=1 Tax=Streptomyces flaveolus TaxID=67297 RepID=UPI0036FDFB98
MTTIRKALLAGRPLPAHQAANAQPTLAQRITAFLDAIPSPHWPAVPASEVNDSWWDFAKQSRVPVNQQARLGRLRQSTLDAAVVNPATPCKVVLYSTAAAGADTGHSLALAEDFAQNCGWRVVGRFADEDADGRPWTRREWQKALSALRGGFAQGVVTLDRSTVAPTDELYEETLLWLLDHFSFVAHAWQRPTTPTVVAPRRPVPAGVSA